MSVNRKLKAGYFSVTETKGSLAAILDEIIAKPVDQRNVTIDTFPFRIEKLGKTTDEKGNTFYEGDFLRLNMDNLPVKAAKDAGVSPIGLADDEGIGEESAFLYSPDAHVFILQRNRAGTSFLRAATYFNQIGHPDNYVEFSVMMKMSALQRLKKAKSFKSVSFSIMPTCSAKDINGSGASLKDALHAMKGLGGEKMSVSISLAPRKEGSLLKDKVTDVIGKLVSMREESKASISSIKVKAEEEDGTDIIDFIKDRLVCSETAVDDSERHISYNTRRDFLRKAWNLKAFQNLITR